MRALLMRWVLAILAVGCLLRPAPVLAEYYALLVGVGQYPHLRPMEQLEGPANDVQALSAVLKTVYRFPAANIVTLVDRQATKRNIIEAIKALVAKTKAGDQVFIFFSGHGTSGCDLSKMMLGLDPFTGALVPHDFQPGSPQDMLDRLIVGNRDLKPLFMQLDKGPRVLVAFDACYSGFTVRGVRPSVGRSNAPAKFVALDWTPKGGPMQRLDADAPAAYEQNTMQEPPYPYQNIVYLAASSRLETAMDIPQRDIDSGLRRTVDGRPHGAFTNALLRGLSGEADTARRGQVSARDLYSHVRGVVSEGFPHTPRLLYNKGNEGALDAPIFGRQGLKYTRSAAEPSRDLHLMLENVDPQLRQRLASLKGVQIVSAEPDIFLAKDSGGYQLFLGSGFPLRAKPLASADEVVLAIEDQLRLKDLLASAAGQQPFTLSLELQGGGGVLLEGKQVEYTVKAQETCHLLLLNVDPSGQITVIYPFAAGDTAPLEAGRALVRKAEVTPPNFGSEFLLAVGFKRMPEGLGGMAGTTFRPGQPKFNELLRMVRGADPAAKAVLRFSTAPRDSVTLER